MPRPKGKSNSAANSAGGKEEAIAPYFRNIFETHRKLLKTRSNKQVLQMWLSDHPGHDEVPLNVKTGLANVKSSMRSKLHKRRGKKVAAEEATAKATGKSVGRPKTSPLLSTNAADSGLEKLEMLVDECLTMARILDRKGLDQIIRALRVARNRVVWKLGEE